MTDLLEEALRRERAGDGTGALEALVSYLRSTATAATVTGESTAPSPESELGGRMPGRTAPTAHPRQAEAPTVEAEARPTRTTEETKTGSSHAAPLGPCDPNRSDSANPEGKSHAEDEKPAEAEVSEEELATIYRETSGTSYDSLRAIYRAGRSSAARELAQLRTDIDLLEAGHRRELAERDEKIRGLEAEVERLSSAERTVKNG